MGHVHRPHIKGGNGLCPVGFVSGDEKSYDKWVMFSQPVYRTG